ncbi:MAG: hypothetical protein WDN25_03775 [Acetobacteraceae bacterium]
MNNATAAARLAANVVRLDPQAGLYRNAFSALTEYADRMPMDPLLAAAMATSLPLPQQVGGVARALSQAVVDDPAWATIDPQCRAALHCVAIAMLRWEEQLLEHEAGCSGRQPMPAWRRCLGWLRITPALRGSRRALP